MKTFMEQEPSLPSPESWNFVRELAERSVRKSAASVPPGAVDLRGGVRILRNFPDPEHRLDTAYEDLEKFFTENGVSAGQGYPIETELIHTDIFEAYRVEITARGCRIQAADTEGIRRGIFFFEDRVLEAGGTAVVPGVYSRKPWVKTRLSRCFFGPIKRPPFNRDELMDSVDYYPDEYLNRLAHEGVNGLWLTISFPDLCRTSFLTPDPDSEKRLAKLRATVNKCLRYGIKTYVFCIEPRAMTPDSELFTKYPETKGSQVLWDPSRYCICTSTENGRRYVYESVHFLFSSVPNLGGLVNISYGERPTSCLSTEFGKHCPRCSEKSPGEILASTMGPMERGMHDAAPDAELICWLYVPLNGTGGTLRSKEMLDLASKLPERVVLQYNYESSGGKEQLGVYRHAGDYWLSYEGPSDIYRQIAEIVVANRGQMSAKIQVGCSHEVATVPFVPVPGLLYRKYKTMRNLGVSHAMQCWYFGNYPGIMNRAAGELAFEEFADTEHDFLLRLARPEWGDCAEKTVEAWESLADGYSHYPLENMFQYYGPVHDGLVWPLSLIPADKNLAPTWRLDYGTSGDRYGECLGAFTFEDVLTLTRLMSEKWHSGTRLLEGLRKKLAGNGERLKDIRVAEALDLQLQTAAAILQFYGLREKLLSGDASVFGAMERIVREEKERSLRMVEFCREDSRLGFHSEAENYKYFPEKLLWRCRELDFLLEEEFPSVRERVKKSLPPLEKPSRKNYCCNSGKTESCRSFSWSATYEAGKLKVRIDSPENADYRIIVEPKPFYPPVEYAFSGKSGEVELPLSTERESVGFNIMQKQSGEGWAGWNPVTYRLVLGDYNPATMGDLVLGDKTAVV